MNSKLITVAIVGGLVVVGGITTGVQHLFKRRADKKAIKNKEMLKNKVIDTINIDNETSVNESTETECFNDDINLREDKSCKMSEKTFNNFIRLLKLIEDKEEVVFDYDFKKSAMITVQTTNNFIMKLKNLRRLLKLDITKYKAKYINEHPVDTTIPQAIETVESNNVIDVDVEKQIENDTEEIITRASYKIHGVLKQFTDNIMADIPKFIQEVNENNAHILKEVMKSADEKETVSDDIQTSDVVKNDTIIETVEVETINPKSNEIENTQENLESTEIGSIINTTYSEMAAAISVVKGSDTNNEERDRIGKEFVSEMAMKHPKEFIDNLSIPSTVHLAKVASEYMQISNDDERKEFMGDDYMANNDYTTDNSKINLGKDTVIVEPVTPIKEVKNEIKFSGPTVFHLEDGTPIYSDSFGFYVRADGFIVPDNTVFEDGEPVLLEDDWDESMIPADDPLYGKNTNVLELEEDQKYESHIEEILAREKVANDKPAKKEVKNKKTDSILVGEEQQDTPDVTKISVDIVNEDIIRTILNNLNISNENISEIFTRGEFKINSENSIDKFYLDEDNSVLNISYKSRTNGNTKYKIYVFADNKIIQEFDTYKAYKSYKKGIK